MLAPRGIELPFGIYEVRYLEYEYEQVELSDEELSAIADQRMDTLICAELDGSPILRKKLGYEPTDSGLTLSCKIRCIQNIASRLPIEIDGIE